MRSQAAIETQIKMVEARKKAAKETLKQLRAELEAVRTFPPEPTSEMFEVVVQFTNAGGYYTFLILRKGGKYYTTGTRESVFDSWSDLVIWLRDKHWVSMLKPLKRSGERYVGINV